MLKVICNYSESSSNLFFFFIAGSDWHDDGHMSCRDADFSFTVRTSKKFFVLCGSQLTFKIFLKLTEVGDSTAKKLVGGRPKRTAMAKKTISAATTHDGKYVCSILL